MVFIFANTCVPCGDQALYGIFLLISAANPGNIKLAKKLDFSLKTFGFSLKSFRRSLKSWRGRGGAAAGDEEGPPGPPLPKGDPQQPPHGMAHFKGGTSTSCDDRDFAAISPGLRVSFLRGAATQRGVAPSSCGVSTGSPPRRRGPKLRPLLWCFQ